MNVHNLDRIFNPRRVAVVEVLDDPENVGFRVLHNLLDARFQGVVYPINSAQEAVSGIHAYPDLAGLPRTPDLAIICTPADRVPDLVRQCGEAGIDGVLILSTGFREAGDSGRRLEHQVQEAAARYPSMRILGPNSLGVVHPAVGLNASYTSALPKPGHLAFLSQSGALSNAILDWAMDKGVGFSLFVSMGNMLDVDFGDLIDYLAADHATRAIILYVQSIEDARSFMSAARACARSMPIVAYKAGQFAAAAKAAASHTGAMIAEDTVYEAAFQRAGVVRVWELDNIFDVAELLACQRLPRGARLAIVSNAGGAAIVATDALLFRKGVLAALGESTQSALHAVFPWLGDSSCNPLDLLDNASPEHFAEATQLVLKDDGVDAVLVILTPQVSTDPTRSARALVAATRDANKPVLATWMGGQRVHEGIQILNQAGFPVHDTPEQAVRAFMHLVSYAHNLELLYETPRNIPLDFRRDRTDLGQEVERALQTDAGYLTEAEAKRLLEAYDIPTSPCSVVHSAAEATQAAQRIGYPVVLKVHSPWIFHKLDVGGVALNLGTAAEVESAFERILNIGRRSVGGGDTAAVTVQKMMRLDRGLQMILGAKKDSTFGSVIMVGMGGMAANIIQDRAVGLPPLNERLARRMLESLRSWPLLRGYRGQSGVHVDRLIEIMIRFSYLVAEYPVIREIDVNPILVTASDITALDAAIALDRNLRSPLTDSLYRHLAIRPYPEEFEREAVLNNGARVTLRPIRPEDEPLWQALIARSSPQSIRFRFRSLLRQISHDMASRHCFIDYEREISIVAEILDGTRPELIGVGGLSADPRGGKAEFAVIVDDRWQGQGLGGLLLDYCLEIAGHWGVRQVIAETDPRNAIMLHLFKTRGFTPRVDIEDDVVYLERDLTSRTANPF